MATTLLLMFGSLFLLLLIGVPIGFSLGISAAITIWFTTDLPMTIIPSACYGGLDSFPLMAIPFFIFAGNLMRHGGISRRLLDTAAAFVGHLRGSVGMVTVLASMFFAAISGSAPATVTSIGSITIPEMRANKYDEGYATALTAAAGTIGVIIPPSIPFVIYGVVANASIGDMFMAGIVPGVMIGVALMLVNYYTARKHNYGTLVAFKFKRMLLVLKDSIWALLVPVIILGGIYGGIFTPTESAVVGVVYAIIIGLFVYKELTPKLIWEALKDTVLINGQTTFLIGFSLAFARYLTMAQIPNKLADSLMGFSNPVVIILMINLLLLILGCFIDNISAMVILTPILLPVVVSLGIDPIMFGIIMVVNLAIGFITPPYGANLFFASAISNVSIVDISKRIIPMIVVMIAILMMLTFMPIWSMGILGDYSLFTFS
ncbi:MAG: TRAP transporter large permease [Clostridiales Family XIII bacterium]|jgi:C4-dicarboxylate transporter DctM subunit|nr:TRAP transporter large permease [Clostridiales Family XIII bacterium]